MKLLRRSEERQSDEKSGRGVGRGMISEPKIIRTGRNHEKRTVADANHLNTVVKNVFKIVIFRKIIDADPTKITKMRRKTYCLEAIDENRRFLASEQFGSLLRQFATHVEK